MRWLGRLHTSACLAALVVGLSPGAAKAHGTLPAEALIVSPNELGVFDPSIELIWIDADVPIPTGTATVNLFYTDAMPPTFEQGTRPEALMGMPIIEGVYENDRANRHVWETSSVSAGTYWIWSLVIEPPEPNPAPQIIHFSTVPVVISHPGDAIPPAVHVTSPSNPFVWADQTFDVEYEAFDPTGAAKVRLEAGNTFDGSDFLLIADNLPATAAGRVTWDTSQLTEGDWTLRAVITDERGFEITAYDASFCWSPIWMSPTQAGWTLGPLKLMWAVKGPMEASIPQRTWVLKSAPRRRPVAGASAPSITRRPCFGVCFSCCSKGVENAEQVRHRRKTHLEAHSKPHDVNTPKWPSVGHDVSQADQTFDFANKRKRQLIGERCARGAAKPPGHAKFFWAPG